MVGRPTIPSRGISFFVGGVAQFTFFSNLLYGGENVVVVQCGASVLAVVLYNGQGPSLLYSLTSVELVVVSRQRRNAKGLVLYRVMGYMNLVLHHYGKVTSHVTTVQRLRSAHVISNNGVVHAGLR